MGVEGTEFYFFWLYLKTHNKSCLTLTLSTCHFLKFLSVTAMNWAYEPNEPKDSLEEHIYSAYELWPTNWRSWDLWSFCIFKEICPYYEDTKELLTRTDLWGPFERTSNSGKIIIWEDNHLVSYSCSLLLILMNSIRLSQFTIIYALMNIIWRTCRVFKIWFYDDLHLSITVRYILLFFFIWKKTFGCEKKSCVIIIVSLKNLLLWSILISIHYYNTNCSNAWGLEKKV